MAQPLVATFSIVARDPHTGDLGVAVASKFLASGAVVPTARAGVGAIASQALANTGYGQRAMELLAAGASPADCAAEFRATDDAFESRQFGIVTASGESYSHTGSDCLDWAGGTSGPGFALQGNILTGPEVVDAMLAAWHVDELPFPERLLAVLRAGDDAGGDARGRQSAALYVAGERKGYGGHTDRWIDLRVDDHVQPVQELTRLMGLWRLILDRPSQAAYQLDSAEISWLQERFGLTVSGEWNSDTETALERLYGRENLEARWLGGTEVDPQAWEHVRRVLDRSPR